AEVPEDGARRIGGHVDPRPASSVARHRALPDGPDDALPDVGARREGEVLAECRREGGQVEDPGEHGTRPPLRRPAERRAATPTTRVVAERDIAMRNSGRPMVANRAVERRPRVRRVAIASRRNGPMAFLWPNAPCHPAVPSACTVAIPGRITVKATDHATAT